MRKETDWLWLSIEETARLWAAETGERADAIERDLEEWFADFSRREPSAHVESGPSDEGPDDGDDTQENLKSTLHRGGNSLRNSIEVTEPTIARIGKVSV